MKRLAKSSLRRKITLEPISCNPGTNKTTHKDYDLTSILTFLVIDPEGKIIFSGHSSGEPETTLAANVTFKTKTEMKTIYLLITCLLIQWGVFAQEGVNFAT